MTEHDSDVSPPQTPIDPTLVSVHRYSFGSWTIIRVAGDLDLQARPLINDVLGSQDRYVAFELDRVTSVDAGGLSILLDHRRRVSESGGLVHLVTPSTSVLRILALTDSQDLFPTVRSADLAVSYLMTTDPWSVS